jgi:hypothetical protein
MTTYSSVGEALAREDLTNNALAVSVRQNTGADKYRGVREIYPTPRLIRPQS